MNTAIRSQPLPRVRVAGTLHAAGLSGQPAGKLAIKMEIGTRPPAGARCERLATLDVQAVVDDVRPFLERPQDASLLTRENLAGLLRDELAD